MENQLVYSIIGASATIFTGLFVFAIGWYLNLIRRRKNYLQKRINEFNDYVVDLLFNRDNKRKLILDAQYPNYLFETKILASEVFVVKNSKNKFGDKNLKTIQIGQVKNIFIFNKKARKRLEYSAKAIHAITQRMYQLKFKLKASDIDQCASTLLFLIREFSSNLKKVTISGNPEFIDAIKEFRKIASFKDIKINKN